MKMTNKPLFIKPTSQFKKDYKKVKKQGKNLKLLKNIIDDLAQDKKLSPKNRDHNLRAIIEGVVNATLILIGY